jgi:uncharacterized membrane protein HdeD (DUF308 family)
MRLVLQSSPQNSAIRGILTIGAGILFLTIPGLTLKSVIMTIGAIIVMNGILGWLFTWVRNKNQTSSYKSYPGFFSLILGSLFLIAPLAIVKIFGFFFGSIFFFLGVLQFMGAMGTLSRSFWSWLFLLFSVLMTLAGLFLLFKPIESAENILTFFGAVLIVYGIFELLKAWRIKKMPTYPNSNNIMDTTYEEV